MSARLDSLKPYVEGMFSPRRWWANIRHPVDALRSVAGDGPVFALVVLFGLNAVDELDRTGFGILIPTIRDHFGMSDTGILSLVALTALGALLLQLPIAWWADRGSRVRLAMFGGIAWGVFSFMTGMSATGVTPSDFTTRPVSVRSAVVSSPSRATPAREPQWRQARSQRRVISQTA